MNIKDYEFIKAQRKEFQCHGMVLVICTPWRDLDSKNQILNNKNKKIKCANFCMVIEF